MNNEDIGKSITFSFDLTEEHPLTVTTTEDILGIVQAYFTGKEFDGVSKYTRLDAEHAFGFFQSCDYLGKMHSEEYLLLMASKWDPDFIHACFLIYECLKISNEAKYDIACQFLNPENIVRDLHKYKEMPNFYWDDFILYYVNDYHKNPNRCHNFGAFARCNNEEEGMQLMRAWLKVIEKDAGHSLENLDIDYWTFNEKGPGPDMQYITWYKTSDPKISFFAEFNSSNKLYRSRLPECDLQDVERFSLHTVHADSPSCNYNYNGANFVKKVLGK